MKFFLLICLTATLFCACQREPDFIDVGNRTTDSSSTNTTIKAIVFDGSLTPVNSTLDYDSLLFSIGSTSSSITHYARSQGVNFTWKDLITYDAQGRIIKFIADYTPGIYYRHSYFSYTGNDSFPSSFIDSTNDGELIINKIDRTGSATSATGPVFTYTDSHSFPALNYTYSFTSKYYFAANGPLLQGTNQGYSPDVVEKYTYNSLGLIDTINTHSTSLSADKVTGRKLEYGSANNPLGILGKTLYKNLYSFISFEGSFFGYHLSLWGSPPAVLEAKVPQTVRDYDENNLLDEVFTYNFVFQGNVLKSGSIQALYGNNNPSNPAVCLMRFYY